MSDSQLEAPWFSLAVRSLAVVSTAEQINASPDDRLEMNVWPISGANQPVLYDRFVGGSCH